MEPAARDFIDLLRRSASFVLTGHEHADGDCLGAQVGLYHLLRSLGKSVRIVLPDAPLRSLEFLARHTPIEVFDARVGLPAADVLVLVDCAELTRLGSMRAAVLQSKPLIAVVDHHVDSERGDGQFGFIDVNAAASGELVARLHEQLGAELSAAAAEGIFVALVSDTGWFRYSNTSPAVLALAARLLEFGVDSASIYDRLFRRNDPDSVALLAAGIAVSRIAVEGRFGVIRLERGIVERAGRIGFDLDHVMEPLRSVAGIEVVAMLKDAGPDRVKLSLRAQGEVDVQAIARSFGGGGHKKAAGATIQGSLDAVEARVEAAVRQAILAAARPAKDGRTP